MVFGNPGPYRFQEWISLSYLGERASIGFRARYLYYYLLLTYVCGQRLYLFFVEEQSLDRLVLHYDYARILFGESTRYIIYVSLLSSMYDSFHRYVFMINHQFVNPFLRIFCQRNVSVGFPVKYFDYKRHRWICQRLYHWVSYGLFTLWLGELMVFPFTLYKIYSMINSKSLYERILYWSSFLWNAYAFHHMLGMMSLVSISGATFGLLYLFLLGKLFKSLTRQIEQRRDGRKLLRWRRHYLQVMIFLFDANRILGPSLTSVICAGSLPHAFLLMYLISHPGMSLSNMANNIFSLVVISTYIFFAHLYCSNFSKLVGRPAKTLFSHLSRGRVRETVRQRLLLSNLMIDIHSNASYGFTYGSHGLIQIRSFTRYLLIYFKIMIFTYKLVFG